MKKRKCRQIMYVIMFCLVLSSTIALYAPLVDFTEDGPKKTLGYVSGAVFWLGLVGGLSLHGWLSRKLRTKNCFESIRPKHVGMIRFFSNTEAIITDITFVIALIVNIVFIVTNTSHMWVEAIAAFLLLVSFHGHYVFNGKTYQYIFKQEGGKS